MPPSLIRVAWSKTGLKGQFFESDEICWSSQPAVCLADFDARRTESFQRCGSPVLSDVVQTTWRIFFFGQAKDASPPSVSTQLNQGILLIT
jgi:hypothetical protein